MSAIIFQYFVALAPVAASLGLFRGERLVDGFAGKANPLSRDFCNYKTGCLNGLPNMMVGSLFLQSDATSRPLPVEAVVSELVMLGRFASVLRSTGCQLVLSQVVHWSFASPPPFAPWLPLAAFGLALAPHFALPSM